MSGSSEQLPQVNHPEVPASVSGIKEMLKKERLVRAQLVGNIVAQLLDDPADDAVNMSRTAHVHTVQKAAALGAVWAYTLDEQLQLEGDEWTANEAGYLGIDFVREQLALALQNFSGEPIRTHG